LGSAGGGAEKAMGYEVEARDLAKSYGDRHVFKGISFHIGHGESLAVVGPNGSGKTTLLKIIAGLLPPTNGEVYIRLEGRPLDRFELRRRMGIVLSERSLYEELTALENISFFTKVKGFRSSRDYLMGVLRMVGLEEVSSLLVSEMSSGMKQRLKIAVAIAHDPGLLILDEPTVNLDPEGLRILKDIMELQKGRGVLLMATADPREGKMCEHVIRLHP
jgi:heme exporter protein A